MSKERRKHDEQRREESKSWAGHRRVQVSVSQPSFRECKDPDCPSVIKHKYDRAFGIVPAHALDCIIIPASVSRSQLRAARQFLTLVMNASQEIFLSMWHTIARQVPIEVRIGVRRPRRRFREEHEPEPRSKPKPKPWLSHTWNHNHVTLALFPPLPMCSPTCSLP